jgi:hypothetical protein
MDILNIDYLYICSNLHVESEWGVLRDLSRASPPWSFSPNSRSAPKTPRTGRLEPLLRLLERPVNRGTFFANPTA